MVSFNAKAGFTPCRGPRGGYRWLDLLLGCGLIAMAACVRAEIVPDLYAVSVPVAAQGQGDLQRAAAAGLRELAVRIAGRSSAASDPALAPVFANAIRYLDQYRYERNTGTDAAWLAQLHFSSLQIDGELRKAGLPVWGGNRPALQTLVVIEDKGTRVVIDDNSPYANALREQWRRRGLVLHLPADASVFSVDDVARLDAVKLGAAAQARADGLLLGRITLTANGVCDSHWLLNLGPQSFNADATGTALTACVASALDRLVDNFSPQYAIAANSGAEGLVLRITGIVSFDDYAALLNYLRRLAAIKNAQPVLVRGDEVLFQLKVEGSAEQLTRQLALESRLTPVDNLEKNSANSPLPVALSYRWTAALKGASERN